MVFVWSRGGTLKVLFINYEFPPIGGGGGNANAYIFAEFAKQVGIEIDCVTSSIGTKDEIHEYSKNIRLHRLAVGKKKLHFWTQREVMLFLWRAQRYSNRLVDKKRFDVCHAFFGFPSGYVAYLQRKRLPYLVSLRGSDVPGFNPRFSKQYVLLKPIFRQIWKNAGRVIANSAGLRDLAHDFMPELDIGIVPNGVNTDEFRAASFEMREPGRILCVSRLIERKGVQHLLEAMPAIVQEVANAKLTIVGEGDLAEKLQRRSKSLRIQDRVEFLGHIPHSDLPSWYRKAQLFVQPSYYEGMSNTVLEAMASGLPLIVSAEGGQEELMRENSRIVPYGDPESLATAVIMTLSDATGMKAMSSRSREIALDYSWSTVAESYRQVYDAIQDSR
jgi:glycosyltransferase involved in cell wall biosynthesis